MANTVCVRTPSVGEADLDSLSRALGREPVLIAAFGSPSIDLAATLSMLARRFPDAVVLGSTTSGEFTHEGDGNKTVALFALAGDYRITAGMATGLAASPERAVASALDGQPDAVEGYPHRTNVVLLDALA